MNARVIPAIGINQARRCKPVILAQLYYAELMTRMNNIESFSPKLREARSRLYRRRFLQVNTRWKALAEIYTMHSFAPFSWDPSG